MNGQIDLKSQAPNGNYEVTFNPFPTKSGASYRVSYRVNVTRGALTLAPEDAINGKFIVTTPVSDSRNNTLDFTAPSESTQIVLFNAGEPPTEAAIESLAVSPVPAKK